MSLESYLAGLKRELRAAEVHGRNTIDQILAEIRRVEEELGIAPPAPVERAVADPEPRPRKRRA